MNHGNYSNITNGSLCRLLLSFLQGSNGESTSAGAQSAPAQATENNGIIISGPFTKDLPGRDGDPGLLN